MLVYFAKNYLKKRQIMKHLGEFLHFFPGNYDFSENSGIGLKTFSRYISCFDIVFFSFN